MTILQEFWLTLFEVLYLPIYEFMGYNSIIAFVCLCLFVAMQVWIFWHFFFKPYIYVCKIFLSIINRNLLFKEVEVDEENHKKSN